jgi:hypothetical protein
MTQSTLGVKSMANRPGAQLTLFLLARTHEYLASMEDDLEFKAQKLASARKLRKQALLRGLMHGKLSPFWEQ